MFILYALAIGVVAGLLLGGRVANLAELRVRWAWLALAGLAVQLVLFTPLGAWIPEAAVPPLYVASTAAVLAVVLRNVRLPGFSVIALGAGLNLLAILANGGYMPADPDALTLAGIEPGPGATNSVVTDNAVLYPLVHRRLELLGREGREVRGDAGREHAAGRPHVADGQGNADQGRDPERGQGAERAVEETG